MVINTRLLVYIWLPALLFSACPSEPDGPSGPPPEKVYNAEILWEREVNIPRGDYTGTPLIEGPYCYFPAYEYDPGGGPNIVKINMETGKVEWETRRIRDSSTGKPQKIGSHIYLPGESGLIFVYNDSDGKLAATVKLGNYETEVENNAIGEYSPVAVSGPYLFWGRSDPRYATRGGLMRFNSRRIDFSRAPGAIQSIAPEKIWSNSWQARIYVNLISENGILYFITSSYTYRYVNEITGEDYMVENPSVLIALDAETGEVIWEREAPHCRGDDYFELVLNGDKLLVVEETFSSYDKLTGIPVLENIPPGNKKWYLRGRITLYNNRLFYLGINEDLVSVNDNGNLIWYSSDKSIVSIDADTGALIWSVFPPQDDDVLFKDFRSSPLGNNGQVFMLHETGLRIYNADTGEFMGVDGSFRGGHGWVFSHEIAVYKDAYIFYNWSSNFVTAIRCK